MQCVTCGICICLVECHPYTLGSRKARSPRESKSGRGGQSRARAAPAAGPARKAAPVEDPWTDVRNASFFFVDILCYVLYSIPFSSMYSILHSFSYYIYAYMTSALHRRLGRVASELAGLPHAPPPWPNPLSPVTRCRGESNGCLFWASHTLPCYVARHCRTGTSQPSHCTQGRQLGRHWPKLSMLGALSSWASRLPAHASEKIKL